MSQKQKAISRKQKRKQRRKRKQKQMGIDGNINRGIDELPDDILINILSHLSVTEAARTSVLARRWRYLWRFNRILRFDNSDTSKGNIMGNKKFRSRVNTVFELHQSGCIEGMFINYENKKVEYSFVVDPSTRTSTYFSNDRWVYFAMQKKVQRFELNFPYGYQYRFPSVQKLISHSHGAVSTSPFRHVRTLRFVNVRILDETVHYFLASCSDLEELCIESSEATSNLRVTDPPSLRILEISGCSNILSVEISAVSLVSFTYEGRKNILMLKKFPNLRKLHIMDLTSSLFSNPIELWSYSVLLDKLVLDLRFMEDYNSLIIAPPDWPQLCSLKRLEVNIKTVPGRSLLYFTSFINASPQLHEFRIEMEYLPLTTTSSLAFDFVKFVHKLKVVEMAGYIGCSSETELLLELFKIGQGSIQTVVIDTKTDFYMISGTFPGFEGYFPGFEGFTRDEAKVRAKDLASGLPKQVKFVVT